MDQVDIEKAYSYSATNSYCVQWYIQSYGWQYLSFSYENTQWKEDLSLATKFACEELCQYFAEVTPTPGILLMSAHNLPPFRKFGSFRWWVKEMDINLEIETSCTIQYQKGLLRYVENEYCTKNRDLCIIDPKSLLNNNLFSSAIA